MRAWQVFLQKKAKELGQDIVDRWLRSLHVVRYDACNLYLEAQDSFQLLWFEEHVKPQLDTFVNNNNSPIKIHLSLKGETSRSSKKQIATRRKNQKQSASTTSSFEIHFKALNPLLTFENFITTHDNMLACKLLEEVCSRMALAKIESTPTLSTLPVASLIPKDIINPIYLYGPSGSGKTHLLSACAHKLTLLGYKSIYCHASLFTEHVVAAMRCAEMKKFRDIYRQADIIFIDDVHLLTKKSATQEEFFHTFNTLHTNGKQIVLSSLYAPQNLHGIESRLISRFEWGCALPLQHLEKKEVIKALEKRAQHFPVPITSQTISFLLETFPNNIKSLMTAQEALVKRSQTRREHTLSNTPLTLQAAKILLNDLIMREKNSAISPEKIVAAVANFYSIDPDAITGDSQSRDCVTPRKISMYLCRKLLKMPYTKIGDLFTRDHSTVMSSVKYIEAQVASVANDLARVVNTIEIAITTPDSY